MKNTKVYDFYDISSGMSVYLFTVKGESKAKSLGRLLNKDGKYNFICLESL